jgi:hypothetical protein
MFDPLHDEIVIHGGLSGTTVGDSWLFNGVWSALGTGPGARFDSAMVYDPIRNEGILFGGCAPGWVPNSETWAYRRGPSGGTWTLLAPATSPAPRCSHTMAWDGARGEIVMFGGYTAGGPGNEMWSWNGTTWKQDTPSSGGPGPRVDAVMAWDPTSARTILFGGGDGGGEIYYGDTWAWDGTAWSQLPAPNGPSQRGESGLAWDRARGRLVLFGGNGGFAGIFDDAYELVGDDWRLVPEQQVPPAMRRIQLVSSNNGGVIMVGGTAADNSYPSPLRLRWDTAIGEDEACTAIDTDGDALAGCEDPDCEPYCEPLCALAEPTCSGGPSCGDGACDAFLESCSLCPGDCGACD